MNVKSNKSACKSKNSIEKINSKLQKCQKENSDNNQGF